LAGRWTCKENGHIFHNKFNPPKIAGICDYDQSELFQRDDDKPDTVKHRIQVYQQQTAPLINYYKERGVLTEVNGTASIVEVAVQMNSLIINEKN